MVDSADAADDAVDAGRFAVLVVVHLVDPLAQRSFTNVVPVEVIPQVAFAGTPCLRMLQMTTLLTYGNAH